MRVLTQGAEAKVLTSVDFPKLICRDLRMGCAHGQHHCG